MIRAAFCGVIEGSVNVRPGETYTEALIRAEHAINAVLATHCKRLRRENDAPNGPVVGLEEV